MTAADLEAVYRDHWAALLRYLRKRHDPADDVEDIAQRAVLVVWRQKHPPGTPMVVLVWNLYRAARYVPRVKPPTGKPGRNGRHPRTDWGKRSASDAWEHLAVEPSAPLAEWLPDDVDEADGRALVLALEGKMTQADIGAAFGRTGSWAACAVRRAVARVVRTQAVAAHERGVKAG